MSIELDYKSIECIKTEKTIHGSKEEIPGREHILEEQPKMERQEIL